MKVRASLIVALLGVILSLIALIVDDIPNILATLGFLISFIGWFTLIRLNSGKGS